MSDADAEEALGSYEFEQSADDVLFWHEVRLVEQTVRHWLKITLHMRSLDDLIYQSHIGYTTRGPLFLKPWVFEDRQRLLGDYYALQSLQEYYYETAQQQLKDLCDKFGEDSYTYVSGVNR